MDIYDQIADACEEAVREGRDMSWISDKRHNLHDVVRAVAGHYGLSESEFVTDRSRDQESVRKRRVAMVLARQITTASYPRIASVWGMDHTTVLHNVRRYEAAPKSPLRHTVQIVKEQFMR